MCDREGCVRYLFDVFFFFQAEDGIRDLVRSRGLGDVYKRQDQRRSSGSEEADPQAGCHWLGQRGEVDDVTAEVIGDQWWSHRPVQR